MCDITKIRQDFSILSEKVYGKPLIYFDNGATTQKPRCVIDAIVEGYEKRNANIHRGVHFLSQQATEAHENARKTVAQFLNAKEQREVIFTRGTTEAINLVAFSFGEKFCQTGDEIVISAMEHHSNIVPWQMLAERRGLKLRVIPINELQIGGSQKGELRLDEFEKLVTEKTKLVALTHVSNVLGTINPVDEIISIAHKKNAKVLIDGAQAVPHLAVDVQALDADFYVFSGHKVYGPTGIGVLYGKTELLEQLPPYQGGGEMIQSVSFEKTVYNELPYKFEAGTPDFIGSVALAEALKYVQHIGLKNIAKHEHALIEHATNRLLEIPDMRIIGTAAQKSGVVSFLVGAIHPYDLGMILDKMGIAVRTGHHCAQPLIDLLGIPGTVRASFGLYNTIDEIDYFIDALKKAVQLF